LPEIALLYGAATQNILLVQNSDFAIFFLRECAVLVTENDLQWNKVHPLVDQFDFADAGSSGFHMQMFFMNS